jgi:hypothetical protein
VCAPGFAFGAGALLFGAGALTIPDHLTEYRHLPDAFLSAGATGWEISFFKPATECTVGSLVLLMLGEGLVTGEMKCSVWDLSEPLLWLS